MPKINPYELRRDVAIVESREFTDKKQPGIVLSLRLEAFRELPFQSAIEEYAKKLATDYAVGRNGGPPAPIPTVKDTEGVDRPIKLTADLCKAIAYLEKTQSPEDPADFYSFFELAALTVTMPDAFAYATAWAVEMVSGPAEDAGANP